MPPFFVEMNGKGAAIGGEGNNLALPGSYITHYGNIVGCLAESLPDYTGHLVEELHGIVGRGLLLVIS